MALPTFSAGMEPTATQLQMLVPIPAWKTATTTINTDATLNDDTDLAWPVVANAVYFMRVDLLFNSVAAADIQFGWSVPSGTTIQWGDFSVDTALAFRGLGNYTAATALTIGTAAVDQHAQFSGVVTVSSTAGTVTLRWAQATSNGGNTSVLAGSHGLFTRVS